MIVDNVNSQLKAKNEIAKELNYFDLLGEKSWQKLHPAIRKRFSHNIDEMVIYKGQMNQVFSSFTGKLLAQV